VLKVALAALRAAAFSSGAAFVVSAAFSAFELRQPGIDGDEFLPQFMNFCRASEHWVRSLRLKKKDGRSEKKEREEWRKRKAEEWIHEGGPSRSANWNIKAARKL
jgi:hypothetical protein